MKRCISIGLTLFLAAGLSFAANTPEGTSWVSTHGYTGCVQLENSLVRVVLEPNLGGRVLEYSYKGANVLFMNPTQDGFIYGPGKSIGDPCGGRCDIGPEKTIPNRPDIWFGSWKAEITGPYSARMTSVEDIHTGVQLVRDFRLDPNSSHLKFTQTIKNVSEETKNYCHWSRTLASGGGICLVPISPGSRFPRGFTIYRDESLVISPPDHENYRIRDNFLIVDGETPCPKFGFDSIEGWMAYITRNDLLFVKRFPVYPERVYSELAPFTSAIFYYKDIMCELEPIGPRETIKPGGEASFTEDWWLIPYTYPSDKKVDLEALTEIVDTKAK